jgi:uncharacterized membrane protein
VKSEHQKSKEMKKIGYFVMLCLWVLGVLGGIGWSLYSGGYVIAVGVAVTGWMAWPKVKEYFTKLTL